MENNDLEELSPEVFNGLRNLQGLYLDQNKLTNLPEGIFNELHNLQKLTLHQNKLTSLPEDIFNELRNLQTLALDNNELSSNLWRQHPNIFNNLHNLKALWLWGNDDLTCLPTLPPSLEGLYLDDDNINSIEIHGLPLCKPNITELGP